MKQNAQRSDDAAVRECGKMSGDPIVVVDFKFFRDALLNDEHIASQGIYRRHERVRGSDLKYRTQFYLLLTARRKQPTAACGRKPCLMVRAQSTVAAARQLLGSGSSVTVPPVLSPTCSRTPSRPAVPTDCINRPDRRLRPTDATTSI